MGDLISRQAAIDALEKSRFLGAPYIDRGILIALREIKKLPSAQPEKRTEERTETHACDLISRQAAIDAHYEYCNKHPDAGFPVWSLKILEDLPSAQPEVLACGEGELIAQPEIVRCKDCKHRDPEDHKCDCGHDIIWQLPRDDKWYCADAERRTDEAR